MPNPPLQKPKQEPYVQTSLRLPKRLRDELSEAAEINGRSLNAEILARLQASPLEEISRRQVEIKAMIRELLDRT